MPRRSLIPVIVILLSWLAPGPFLRATEPPNAAPRVLGVEFGQVRHWQAAPPHGVLVEMNLDTFPIISDFASKFSGDGWERRARHAGIDIAAHPGTPVLAAADGVVAVSRSERRHGETISLRHGDTGIRTVYMHLRDRAVFEGERVRRGQIIGATGWTGVFRGAHPHLHFGVAIRKVDGTQYAEAVASGLNNGDWIYLNPHLFHYDGKGEVTMFDRDRSYDGDAGGSLRITYPLPSLHDLAHFRDRLQTVLEITQR